LTGARVVGINEMRVDLKDGCGVSEYSDPCGFAAGVIPFIAYSFMIIVATAYVEG